jgi:indolepyruvate ferredoxin oxidoreductase beta subunit
MPVLIGNCEYKEKEIDDELKRLNAKILNAAQIAQDLGNAKVMNIILLGALVKSMNLENINWEKIIRENVKEKFIDINLKAFEEGMNLVSKKALA